MSLLSRLQSIDEADKTKAVRKLVKDSTPDYDYFLMIVLSVLMATFGLLADSESIVIGAMLLAPLLAPILGLSLGTSMSYHKLIRRSSATLIKSIALAIGASVIATLFFAVGNFGAGVNASILARTEPSLIFFIVAIISGFAVSYAMVRPELSESLPGVAIAVALIPPLAVVGIGLALFNWSVVAGASVMFFVNVAGIVFAGMISFSLMDVHHKRFIASKVLVKEEKRVVEEEIKVEEIQKKNQVEDAILVKEEVQKKTDIDTRNESTPPQEEKHG